MLRGCGVERARVGVRGGERVSSIERVRSY